MMLADFYRAHYPIVVAKCARMLEKDVAQDIAQETFVRLWQSPVAQAGIAQRTKWIYRTATRLAIDCYRQRRRRREEPLARWDAPMPAVPDEILDARRQLAALQLQIPDDELEVAILHRLDGLSQAEIATILECSERTVRRILVRLARRTEGLRQGATP